MALARCYDYKEIQLYETGFSELAKLQIAENLYLVIIVGAVFIELIVPVNALAGGLVGLWLGALLGMLLFSVPHLSKAEARIMLLFRTSYESRHEKLPFRPNSSAIWRSPTRSLSKEVQKASEYKTAD